MEKTSHDVRSRPSLKKSEVYEFWNRASCGETLFLKTTDLSGYEEQARLRYELEPWILPFGKFDECRGLRVLEIGVGLGADHERLAAAGADLYGIDLTERAVEHTRQRLALRNLSSKLNVGDAEDLRFPDAFFDVVYSWGVLHHTPNTQKAISEVHRVLKPGGIARIMLYHKWSLVGLMLWVRYALFALKPWRSLAEIYATYLESPGTKAYTVAEAKQLFSAFQTVRTSVVLTHGDLLESRVGQRHRGWVLEVARRVWPRWFLRRWCRRLGLHLLIEATR